MQSVYVFVSVYNLQVLAKRAEHVLLYVVHVLVNRAHLAPHTPTRTQKARR